MSDAKWTYDDAYSKAVYRLQTIVDGSWNPGWGGKTPQLIPDVPPFYQSDALTLEEAEDALATVIGDFFNEVSRQRFLFTSPDALPPRVGLKVTMGLGKTRQTAQRLVDFVSADPSLNVEVYVPRHDLGSELADTLRCFSDGKDVSIVQIRGRGQTDDDGVVMCARYDVVERLEKAGHPIRTSACYQDQDNKCQHYDNCPYWKQFQPQMSGTIRILPHAYLGLRRITELPEPDLVVIDEGPLQSLHDKIAVNPKNLREQLTPSEFPELGSKLLSALRGREPLLQHARDIEATPELLRSLGIEGAGNQLEPGLPDHKLLALSKSDSSSVRNLQTFCEVLSEELETHPNRDAATRIRYSEGLNQVWVNRIKPLSISDNVPLLLLDATADPKICSQLFPGIRLFSIEAEQKANVTQVYDRAGSNEFWKDESHISELATVLNGRARFGHNVLVVGSKDLADSLRSLKLRDNVSVAHFNALRGSNEYEQCDTIVMAGRNQPPAHAVEGLARAIFWKDPAPIVFEDAAQPDSQGYLPRQARGYRMLDPTEEWGVYANCFTDPRIEAVHAQLREAETVQAIARLRLVRAQSVKRVFILSNLPVDLTVNSLSTWDDLMPSKLDTIFDETGILPMTGRVMYLLHPDKIPNQEAAKKAIQRSKGHAGYQDALFHLSMLKASFRLVKNGKPYGKPMEVIIATESDDATSASLSHSDARDMILSAVSEVDSEVEGLANFDMTWSH